MQPGMPMAPQGMPMPGYGSGYQTGYQTGYGPGYGTGYGMPVPGPVPGPKVNSGVLAGVSIWRLVIVVFAITGFSLALGNGSVSGALAALSQQASLVTAIGYLILLLYPAFTGGRRHEPVSPWLRGALVVLLGLVSVTFLTMLGGELNQTWSLFEHLLTPLIVLVDWLFVGADQRFARWWYPFTWLAFPLAYLLFYVVYVNGGEPIYPFLDPSAGDFIGVVFGFLAGVLAWGFVVYGMAKLKGSIADSTRQTAQPVGPVGPWGPPPMR
jgi:hypothetical protein